MSDLPDGGGSVPHEEAVHVEPVRLLPVEEGGLHHRRQPEVALRHVKYYLLACMMDGVRYLGNVRLACFALGAAGLGVLGPERQVVGGHVDGQSLKVGFLAPFSQVKTSKP